VTSELEKSNAQMTVMVKLKKQGEKTGVLGEHRKQPEM